MDNSHYRAYEHGQNSSNSGISLSPRIFAAELAHLDGLRDVAQ